MVFSAGMETNIQATKKILDSGTSFDLVVVNVFPTNEIGHYIAHKSKAPSVIFSTYQNTVEIFDYALGNPINTATVSGAFTFKVRYTQFQRLDFI